MKDILKYKNNNGIIKNRYEEMDNIEKKLFYLYYKSDEEQELKEYIKTFLDTKCLENNQETNNFVMNNYDIKKMFGKKKLALVKNNNCTGTFILEKNKIEIYTDIFYNRLKQGKTKGAELNLVKAMYHEMQHQLQVNNYMNEKFISELKLIRANFKFYLQYHNYFEIEIDAESRGLERFITDISFGDYPIFEKYINNIVRLHDVVEARRKSSEYKTVEKELIKYR